MRVHSQDIHRLVEKSSEPLNDPWLDVLTQDYMDSVSTRLNYYRFLYHLVGLREPRTVLELGVECGLASAHMCAACVREDANARGSRVIGVDLNWHETPGERISKKYNHYRFLVGDSVELYPRVESIVCKTGLISVVYQDSSHHYGHSCKEWELYSRLLSRNAIWVCDDIILAHKPPEDSKGMVDYFNERPGVKMTFPDVLHYGNTMGVIMMDRPK